MSKLGRPKGIKNHAHTWQISEDQSNTGVRGVRKFCTTCGERLTFIKEQV